MRQGDRMIPTMMLAVIATVSLAVSMGFALASPPTPGTGVVEQETTSIDAHGNTVVTERTLTNGRLVKTEVTVTSPTGQFVSRVDTTYNPATGQITHRDSVTVTGGTITKTEQVYRDGQLVHQVTHERRIDQDKKKSEGVKGKGGGPDVAEAQGDNHDVDTGEDHGGGDKDKGGKDKGDKDKGGADKDKGGADKDKGGSDGDHGEHGGGDHGEHGGGHH